jgi:hypothetical protein
MLKRIQWTDEMDEQIRRLRWEWMTWDSIGTQLSLSRNTVLERGRKIGASKSPPVAVVKAEAVDRPCLQPGHPETWGLITRGTVLDGAPYPYPVFL